METLDLVIPTTLEELKQGLGLAILRAGFLATMGKEPPDVVIRSATRGNNVEAADMWLAARPRGIADLRWMAERAIAEEGGSRGEVMTSFISDMSKCPDVKEFLSVCPMGYFGKLIKATSASDDTFIPLLRLFLEL